jgi:hypothetical protein
MLSGSALLKKDPRPFVLYLRSFRDDSSFRMWARTANGRILPERLVRISFEEVVADHLWGYGPVLAIGDPKTSDGAAPLGAARDYTLSSDWQNHVSELMQRTSLIVAVVAQTSGLAWEIDAVARHGLLAKFVLLFPPVDNSELKTRFELVRGLATDLEIPLSIELSRLRSITFPKNRICLIYGDKSNDWTYEACLDQAALGIIGSSQGLPTSRGRTITKVAKVLMPEFATFVRSALVFLAIAAFVFISYGASLYRQESSHPFARKGAERDEFIAGFVSDCGNNKREPVGYCNCFANRIADSLTYGEYKALEKPEHDVTVSVMDNKASFAEKARAAAHACSQ